jgi:hypothetical protein
VKNPAEKTTVRPNQNVKRSIAGRRAVMESGFILITNRHLGCDYCTPFRDDSNRITGHVRCRRRGLTGRRRRRRWLDTAFCRLNIPGIERNRDDSINHQEFHRAIGFHGLKCIPENGPGSRCLPRPSMLCRRRQPGPYPGRNCRPASNQCCWSLPLSCPRESRISPARVAMAASDGRAAPCRVGLGEALPAAAGVDFTAPWPGESGCS